MNDRDRPFPDTLRPLPERPRREDENADILPGDRDRVVPVRQPKEPKDKPKK